MLPVSVVVATRNRRASLLRTLGELAALPEPPATIVVDNGSTDGAPDAVREAFPDVTLVRLGENAGAAARTVGARLARTPYVAFADDDSWWAPGALERAASILGRDARIALVAARVLVDSQEYLDPTSAAMRESPLGTDVLGFVACGAVVRRDLFLEVGGFHERLGVGGEETLLALDLADRGHRLVYADDVVAHHHPAQEGRDDRARLVGQARNAVLVAWLRLTVREAAARTRRLLRAAAADPHARRAALSLAGRVPLVVRERHRVAPAVERDLLRVERAGLPSAREWVSPTSSSDARS